MLHRWGIVLERKTNVSRWEGNVTESKRSCCAVQGEEKQWMKDEYEPWQANDKAFGPDLPSNKNRQTEKLQKDKNEDPSF